MRSLILVLTLLAALNAGAQPAKPLAEDMAQLVGWFGGEWNNHEQVWQQKIDRDDPKVAVKLPLNPHRHHLFAPVAAPQIGANLFYVQQAAADDLARPYRQRLVRFVTDEAERAIKLESFRFKDEAKFLDAPRKPELLAALTPSDLLPMPGCEVWWRADAERQRFLGTMKKDACRVGAGQDGNPIVINESLELDAQHLRIDDRAGVPSLHRKVHYFEGWVWIKHAGPQAAADDRKASFTRRIQLHSEGQRLPVMYEDGSASPYLLELAQLTYQNTRQAILKFALIDKASGKSLAYIWANPDATRVGMNLGWFQAGLTQKSERAAFGF